MVLLTCSGRDSHAPEQTLYGGTPAFRVWAALRQVAPHLPPSRHALASPAGGVPVQQKERGRGVPGAAAAQQLGQGQQQASLLAGPSRQSLHVQVGGRQRQGVLGPATPRAVGAAIAVAASTPRAAPAAKLAVQ